MISDGSFPRFSLRGWTTAVAMVLIGSNATVAQLVPVTQTRAIHLNAASPPAVLHFDPFDSSLGTLEDITLSFTGTRRLAWAVWNTGATNRAVDYTAAQTDVTLTAAGHIFSLPQDHFGPASTPTALAPVTFLAAATEFSSGRSAFLGGGTPVFPSAFQQNLSSVLALDLGSLALSFTGDLDVNYDPGAWSLTSAGGNVFSASLDDIEGGLTITYDYSPRDLTAAVPEPATALASAMVLSAAALVRWQRRKKHQ